MTNKSKGILPDNVSFADVKPEWSSNIIDPAHPIATAITNLWNKCRIEEERCDLAVALDAILHDDLQVEYARSLGNEDTRRIYKSHYARYQAFCAGQRLSSLPSHPEGLAYYILVLAANGSSPDTIAPIVSAIRWAHEMTDEGWSFDDVKVRAALRFIRRCWDRDHAPDEPSPNTQPDATPTKEREPAHHGT